jgi:hypothetical protein
MGRRPDAPPPPGEQPGDGTDSTHDANRKAERQGSRRVSQPARMAVVTVANTTTVDAVASNIVAVTSSAVDVRSSPGRVREHRSVEDVLGALRRFVRAIERRVDADECGLVELAAVVELAADVVDLRDHLARRLLADTFSYREVGIALGISRQAAERRYPGATSRRPGAQPGPLR